MFKRNFDDSLRVKLEKEELYKSKILPDILVHRKARKKGEDPFVFPAIRNEWIGFYHKGGKLFSYDRRKGFETHIKYASVYESLSSNAYISETQLSKLKPIAKFIGGYGRIKENCEKYAREEASGVFDVCSRCSYILGTKKMVLDIEVSLKSEKDDKSEDSRDSKSHKTDRIDVLFFNSGTKCLTFCEAKHYSNPGIRCKPGKEPKVVTQIEGYERQIPNKKREIIEAYRNYVEIVNEMFSLHLPPPEHINPKVILLIFGFDKDQSYGKLKQSDEKVLKDCGIEIYPKGGIKTFEINNMEYLNKCES